MRNIMLAEKESVSAALLPPPTLPPTSPTIQLEPNRQKIHRDSPECTQPSVEISTQIPHQHNIHIPSVTTSPCGTPRILPPATHLSATPTDDPSVSCPTRSGDSTSTDTFINECCDCRVGASLTSEPANNCSKCNPLFPSAQNNRPRKLPVRKKMPFPMSAFILSGVGMFLLCTVLSVTVQTTEAEINNELTEEAVIDSEGKTFHHHPHGHLGLKLGLGGHHSHHHQDPSAISVNKYSDGHHDVTQLQLKPFKQIFVTKHQIVFPIMSYELVQKIKHFIRAPLELIQWLIPHFILLKEFFTTFLLFVIKLLDVKNDFYEKFHFDENELGSFESGSREL